MSRPGHDLSWRAIRQRHTRVVERRTSMAVNPKDLATPLLATSSKSLLANVASLEDQVFIPKSITNQPQ